MGEQHVAAIKALEIEAVTNAGIMSTFLEARTGDMLLAHEMKPGPHARRVKRIEARAKEGALTVMLLLLVHCNDCLRGCMVTV